MSTMNISEKNDKNRLPEFPECFVCGTQNRRGLHLPFYRKEQSVRAEFIPDKECAGYLNTMHGGIISAVLDEALVWAAYVGSGRFGVTAEINVRFLKPVSTGSSYSVSGHSEQIKRRMCLCSAVIVNSDGKLCARAAGKVLLMNKQQSDDLLNSIIPQAGLNP